MNRIRVLLPVLALAAVAPALVAKEFAANHLFAACGGTDRILELDEDGAKVREIGAGSGLAAPLGIAFGPRGHLFVAAANSNRVFEFDADGVIVDEIGAGSDLSSPRSLAFGPGGHLFVTSVGNDRVIEFDADGDQVRLIGEGSSLDFPTGIAIGPDGHLYVASLATDRVFEFDASGKFVRQIGKSSGLTFPSGIAFGPNGNLFVGSNNSRVIEFDATGTKVDEHLVDAIVSDVAFAPDGRMLVSNSDGNEIDVVDLGGGDVGSIENDDLEGPTGIAFAPFRFKTTVSGTLADGDGAPGKSKEKAAILSFAPGSRSLLLELPDEASLVFHGFEEFSDDAAKTRFFRGLELPRFANDFGLASLAMTISGKVDGGGRFRAKSLAGTLHRATGATLFNGTISTKKPLE